MTQTLLIIEDEWHIVEVVRDYLEQSGYQVVAAREGPAGLALARSERPALILLDLMLPGGMDGFDVCREIRRDPALDATPIVMLTARVELPDRLVGLELGADDYITKPFSPREVVARVKAVLRRTEGYGLAGATREASRRDVLYAGELEVDLRRRMVRMEGQPVTLTPTEFDLLATMAREPGRVFTREQLVESVYDVAYDGYDRAIDSHVKNLRQKLEPEPRNPRIVLTVYGVGYKVAE